MEIAYNDAGYMALQFAMQLAQYKKEASDVVDLLVDADSIKSYLTGEDDAD